MNGKMKLMFRGLAVFGLIFLLVIFVHHGYIETVKDLIGIKNYSAEIGKSIASIRG